MSIAATDQDLVIGMCIHLVIVPTPAGPVQVPMPFPFVSMISDPGRKAAQNQTAPMAAAGGEMPDDRPLTSGGMLATAVGTVTKNATACPHVAPLPPAVSWAPAPKPPAPPCGVREEPPPPDSPLAEVLATFRKEEATHIDAAAERLGRPIASVSEAVLLLELGGWLRALPGARYVRVK